MNGSVDGVFAHIEKLTNFVNAMSAKSKGLGSEISSLLVFVERRHKQLLLGCEHFWRSVRNHLKYRRIVFKVTNFSPVLQIYLVDNQIFKSIFLLGFRLSFSSMEDISFYRFSGGFDGLKLYQVIF